MVIDIHKEQRHDHLLGMRTQDAGDGELACSGGIASREIKDHDLSTQIQRDKMAGMPSAIALADNLIGLVGSRVYIG